MITATVVCDSTSKHNRLTTFELSFPKSLQAQFNTHRQLSKNAASSRAIPTKKIIRDVMDNPFIPVWSNNQKGMKGDLNVTPEQENQYKQIWLEARDNAVDQSLDLSTAGASKENVNRLLEPFMYGRTVCSATDLENFFNLRDHPDAQEEIAILAREIRKALDQSTPKFLAQGEWHLPYVLEEERKLPLEVQIKISVARCARVSYKLNSEDMLSTVEKDTELYTRLLESKHFSPFEHVATPCTEFKWFLGKLGVRNSKSGNFNGFNQLRHVI